MKKGIIIALILFVILSVIIFFALKGGQETIVIRSRAKVKNGIDSVVYSSAVRAAQNCGELLNIEKDSAGKITLLELDSKSAAALALKVCSEVNDSLKKLSYEGIEINAGDLLSSPYTVGKGFLINIGVMEAGEVSYTLKTQAKESGINQTEFSLIINLNCDMRIFYGLAQDNLNSSVSIPVYDVIIVGDVPETYAKLDNATDFMNLIP